MFSFNIYKAAAAATITAARIAVAAAFMVTAAPSNCKGWLGLGTGKLPLTDALGIGSPEMVPTGG